MTCSKDIVIDEHVVAEKVKVGTHIVEEASDLYIYHRVQIEQLEFNLLYPCHCCQVYDMCRLVLLKGSLGLHNVQQVSIF